MSAGRPSGSDSERLDINTAKQQLIELIARDGVVHYYKNIPYEEEPEKPAWSFLQFVFSSPVAARRALVLFKCAFGEDPSSYSSSGIIESLTNPTQPGCKSFSERIMANLGGFKVTDPTTLELFMSMCENTIPRDRVFTIDYGQGHSEEALLAQLDRMQEATHKILTTGKTDRLM